MKKAKCFHHRYIANLFIIVIFMIGGCTHMYKQPLHEINLTPINDKINLSVGLIMTSEFRNAKWEKKSMGDTWILPIGENLVHHTVQLIKRVFTQSMILKEGVATQDTKVTYVMTPKVIFIEQAFGVSAFSEAKTSISVEWKLAEVSGKAVWVESIKGVGTGKAGNVFTGKEHMKERFKMALQDLFEKSQNAMLSSRLLRNLK